MKLRAKELCPLHRRRDCCGRSQEIARAVTPKPNWRGIGPGVREYPGGRIVKTPAALKRRKDFLLKKETVCAACEEAFTDYREVDLAHREGAGMSGWKRDDSDANTTLLHHGANIAQGSLDLEIYLRDYWRPEHCGVVSEEA